MTMTCRSLTGCLLLVLVAATVTAADPIPGVGPIGETKKLHSGLEFTEGPAWDGKGRLYFTDIPADTIHRTDGETLESFAKEAGHCNGLMFDAAGTLYACAMDGALVAFNADGEKTVLADKFDDKRFNAPNDLVIDRTGGIYFTDPRFRAPRNLPQGEEAVYYRSVDGEVTRLKTGLDKKAPNGVILSPDEKTLYVIPSMQAEMMAYPVTEPGVIGEGTVFCKLQQPVGIDNSGGDGLTIDTSGNVYITSQLGVQVFSPEGERLGLIELPEQPANITFGGADGKTLYATARTSLYAIPMEAQGHVFPGKTE